jgi:hypothetical protein
LVFLGWGSPVNGQEDIPVLENVSVYRQYQKTMKTITFLGEIIHDYVEHFEKAPQANNFDELMKLDCGNGLTFAEFFFDEMPEEQIPLKDVWENKLLYKCQGKQFWIASTGSDGEFKGFEQIGPYPGTIPYIQGKDIIFSNGRFVSFPIDKKEFDYFFHFFIEALSSFH